MFLFSPNIKAEEVHPESEVQVEEDDNDLDVNGTRAKFKWKPDDLIIIKTDLSLSSYDKKHEITFIEEAYIDLKSIKQFELRLGIFDKPFSGFLLNPPIAMNIVEDGDGKSLLLEKLSYGDRDFGLQISGMPIENIPIKYFVGAFNGGGIFYKADHNSIDIVGRIETTPHKFITFGVNTAIKLFDEGVLPRTYTNAYGNDIRLRYENIQLHLETLRGENHIIFAKKNKKKRKHIYPAPVVAVHTACISYTHRFYTEHQLIMQPWFKFEILDKRIDTPDNEIFNFVPGISLKIGEYIRLIAYSKIRYSEDRIKGYKNITNIMLKLRILFN